MPVLTLFLNLFVLSITSKIRDGKLSRRVIMSGTLQYDLNIGESFKTFQQ